MFAISGRQVGKRRGLSCPTLHFTVSGKHFPQKHLVRSVQVSSMFNQTLHNVMVAPGRSRQQRGLSLPVLDIHIAANFTKGFSHRVIAMPGSTVQGRFLFLVKITSVEEEKTDRKENTENKVKAMEVADRDYSQCGKNNNLLSHGRHCHEEAGPTLSLVGLSPHQSC